MALILDELNRLKVPLIASSQGIDSSEDNPAGRLQVGVLMAVVEFERGIIRERVNLELATAKARGVKLGRPPKLKAKAHEIMTLKKKGLGVRNISRQLGMPVSSVHAVLKAHRDTTKKCCRYSFGNVKADERFTVRPERLY